MMFWWLFSNVFNCHMLFKFSSLHGASTYIWERGIFKLFWKRNVVLGHGEFISFHFLEGGEFRAKFEAPETWGLILSPRKIIYRGSGERFDGPFHEMFWKFELKTVRPVTWCKNLSYPLFSSFLHLFCWSKAEICTGRILSARPGPARPVDFTARPGPARGPEFEFRARPVSARGMAKPGPARPGPARPGPVRSGSAQQKQFPWDFLKLFNLIKQFLFNGFVGYLFVTDAPQGWIPTCICKKYIDQRWKNYYYNWEIRTL